MPVDTRGLQQKHVGKRLRLELGDGRIDEIHLLELTVCEEPEPCCGATYTLLATNRADGSKEIGTTYWTGFNEIKRFQVLGD